MKRLFLLIAVCFPLLLAAQNAPDILWQDSAPYGYTITDVAVSPDGTYAVTPGGDGVQVWRVADGTKVLSLAHGYWTGALAFSPDGVYLAAGGGEPAVTVWRVSDWSLAYALTNDASPGPVAFSPDSTLLASTLGYTLQLRNATNGALLSTWTNSFVDNSLGGVVCLAFSPDGTKLASGSGYRGKDTNVSVWSVPSGALLMKVPTAQTYYVGFVAFSPDGQLLATAGGTYAYGPMQLWRVADGSMVRTFPGGAYGGAFSPDGAQLAVIGTNIDFYAVANGALISHYTDYTNGSHYDKAVAMTPDGSAFLRVCYPSKVFAARVPLWIHPLRQEGNKLLLSWSGGSGQYQLQQRTNLLEDTWQNAGGVLTNRTAELTPQSPNAFFRVIASAQP